MPANNNYNNNTKDTKYYEKNLSSKVLKVENKLLYLDVNQNERGKFMKITENGMNGQKFRIIFTLAAVSELKQKLDVIVKSMKEIAVQKKDEHAPDVSLHSEMIVRDNRRYYLDLKENSRGRYLRLAMISMGNRVQIIVPAVGIEQLRTCLDELIQEHSTGNDTSLNLPGSRVMFLKSKTFYFDVGSNRYGAFLRVSEVRMDARTAITIPENRWSNFCSIINSISDSLKNKSKNGIDEKEEENLNDELENLNLSGSMEAAGDKASPKKDGKPHDSGVIAS